jgi:hypothetical protein
MNGAFSALSYGLNNFELCSTGQKLEALEMWHLKVKYNIVNALISAYSSQDVKLACRRYSRFGFRSHQYNNRCGS